MLTAQLGTANSYPMNVQLGIPDCSDDFTAQLGTKLSWPQNIILGIEDTCPGTPGTPGPFTYTLTASNTLALTETVSRTTVLNFALSNTLTLTEKIAKGALASNTLSLVQVAVGDAGIPVTSSLSLVQTVSVTTVLNLRASNPWVTLKNAPFLSGDFSISVSNTLTPHQAVARIITVNVTASNVFSPTHSNESYEQYDLDQTLVMTQVAVTIKHSDRSIVQSLVFTQEATYTASFNVAASNEIKFIGGYTRVSEISALSVTIPEVQVTKLKGKLIIQAETGVIVLPRPILGDTENYEGTVVVKHSIVGDVYTYIRRTDLRKLKYTLQLERKKSLELKEFIRNFNSQPLTLSNWKGETWFGCIVTDPLELIPKSRWATCGERVDVTIEFEGIRIN